MEKQRLVQWLASFVLVAFGNGFAISQNYPNATIRIVAPEAGGGGDLVARIVAQGLTPRLGQQVIVDNRGGSAVIAAGIVAKAAPDGYVLLLSASAHWLLPLFESVPYDPIKDFAPISMTTLSPAVIAVHPSVDAKSLKELMALAKSKPGQMNVGSGTKGSTTYLSAELFKVDAGLDIVSIPYKGAGPALTAVMGKQVDMIIMTAGSVMPHAKSGKLRALAVASARPSPLAPGLPTATEAGLPGFESGSYIGMFAPAKTPESITMKLNQEIVQHLNQPEIKSKLFGLGLDVVGSSPSQLMTIVQSEMSRIEKMISKIKP